jgi:SAM-dependent methyltransferase
MIRIYTPFFDNCSMLLISSPCCVSLPMAGSREIAAIRDSRDEALMFKESLSGAVPLSHLFLKEKVKPGDRVADATCGNGHDTLFLARLVGENGKVWAFDIQENALANTRKRLAEAGCLAQVDLVSSGHERLAEYAGEPLQAAVFNLGYLPGGNKEIITRADASLAALEQAAGLLVPGGIITVCIYTGHPGGADEGAAVEKWATALPPAEFNVWLSRQINRQTTAPYVLLIEKVLT